jgi:hypothetical protein
MKFFISKQLINDTKKKYLLYFKDKKNHRNGIYRPKTQRYPSLNGVNITFVVFFW